MFKVNDSASASLVDSFIYEVDYDYRYVVSNMNDPLVTSPETLEKYVDGSIVRFNAIASFLFYNGHVTSFGYRRMKDCVKDYKNKIKIQFLGSDIQSAFSDPEFVQGVTKAVEKYGTIN